MTPAQLFDASMDHERRHAPNRNARAAWLDSIEARYGCRGMHQPKWDAQRRKWTCANCGRDLDAMAERVTIQIAPYSPLPSSGGFPLSGSSRGTMTAG